MFPQNFKLPNLNTISKFITTVVEGVKTVCDLFKLSSNKIAQTDGSDSLDNIEIITDEFSKIKEKVHEKTADLERQIDIETAAYVENLLSIIEEKSEIAKTYGIHIKRIEGQIDRAASKVKTTIDNEILRSVSLDNKECREIVKMISGSKKEAALDSFFSATFRRALDSYCNEYRSFMNDISNDVETEVKDAVETLQKQIEEIQKSLASVDENNYEETSKEQMTKAYYLKDVCELVERSL